MSSCGIAKSPQATPGSVAPIRRIVTAVARSAPSARQKARGSAKKRRRKKREHKAQAVKRVLALIGQIRNDTGASSEKHVVRLVEDFARAGRIQCFIHAEKLGFLDTRQVDILVRRSDGAWVPIQVKASWTGRAAFRAKYRDRWEREHGALPVLFVSPPSGFRDVQVASRILFAAIQRWPGTFVYAPLL